jgi:glycosyltransferase involved in cell wall biosynthesis
VNFQYWAVIPSKSRPAELAALVEQLLVDDVNVVVVDNGVQFAHDDARVHVIRDFEDPPNLSRLWNVGLRYVKGVVGDDCDDYYVAVLNDDLVLPEYFVTRISATMLGYGAAVGYPDQHRRGANLILVDVKPFPLQYRMTGYAFVLRGSAGIFADETIKWWYGDNDIEWQARTCGGTLLVGGIEVNHLFPDHTTVGDLMVQAGKDRETFVKKWGMAPW